MKVSQLRDVLNVAQRLQREVGNDLLANSIYEFSALLASRESMSVAAFVRAIERSRSDVADHSATKIANLRLQFEGMGQMYAAAGSKGPAKDFAALSSALRASDDMSVDMFCRRLKFELDNKAKKGSGGSKSRTRTETAPSNTEAVRQHVVRLRSAGTNREAFDFAFEALKADKSLKSSDVAAIARQYGDTVSNYRSIKAAQTDISKAFVRQARFASKLL